MTDRPSMVAIDGTDAVFGLIIRDEAGRLTVEVFGNRLSKASAAGILRHLADEWDDNAADKRDEVTP
jgi:hypothetical protein